MKKRLDQCLVDEKFAPTRSQAQLLIREGRVAVNAQCVKKTGHLVSGDDQIELYVREQYVGRGAFKLKAAVEAFGVNPAAKVVADCGASTGGFTDYLLQHGAKKVYCLDVGHGQLDAKLCEDERVINLEGVNLKHPYQLPEFVDLVVADLSFISLRLVLLTLQSFLKSDGEMIFLFKPQFEVGKEALHKNGIVKNENLKKQALEAFLSWLRDQNIKVIDVISSPLEGKKGNEEYLLYLKNML